MDQSQLPPPKKTSIALPGATPDLKMPILRRTLAAINGAAEGLWNGWMGPGVPLQVMAPAGTPARMLDYPMQYNVNVAPRSGERVSFQTLRALAENSDIFQVVMNRRKNQIVTQDWDIQKRDEKDQVKDDKSIDAIKDFLQYPDREHDIATWWRACLDQVFVYDALSIEPIYDGAGDLFALHGINGATIQLKIDDTGRTPMVPNVAYQQIVKGIVACEFTKDQLLYKPWNVRFDRIFGFPIAEQIIMMVNIALRREEQQLLAFTAGSLPDALMALPEGWSPAQISEWQKYWDSKYLGNLKTRAGLSFIPHGSQAVEVRVDPLKNDFDEWIARVMCFAFGVSPSGLVKDMNRATADSARTMSLEEGAAADMQYLKAVMDQILRGPLKRPDLEFVWADESQTNPVEEMNTQTGYIKVGVYSVDYVKGLHGLDPVGMEEAIFQNAGPPIFLKDIIAGTVPAQALPAAGQGTIDSPKPEDDEQIKPKPKGGDATKAAKKRRRQIAMQPMVGKRAAEITMKRAVLKVFKANRETVTDQAWAGVIDATKADAPDNEAQDIADTVDLTFMNEIPAAIKPILTKTAKASARQAFVQVGGNIKDLLDQVDVQAVEWADHHAAELVGMVHDEIGNLVENPNAEYSITDNTRNMLKVQIDKALKEGWSRDRLADAIAQGPLSETRALNIAQTELAFAHSASNMAGWRLSDNVQSKRSLLSADHDKEDECDDNADAGWIPLDDDFPSGDDSYPFHPNCQCSVVVRLKGDEGDDEEEE